MAVVFEELAESPRLSINRNNIVGTRRFLINWSDIQNFTSELYGGWVTVAGTSTLVKGATFPGYNWLWVSNVDIEPFGDRITGGITQTLLSLDGPNQYAKALVVAKYEPIPDSDSNGGKDNKPGDSGSQPTIPEGTTLDLSTEDGVDLVTVPGRHLKWVNAPVENLPDDQPFTIEVGTEQWTFAWQRVPSPPWTSISIKKGAVNNATFFGQDAGKVLFLGSRAKRRFQPNGNTLWDLEYRFKVRSVPWNYSYRKSTSQFEEVKREDGTKPFGSADFMSLFALG